MINARFQYVMQHFFSIGTPVFDHSNVKILVSSDKEDCGGCSNHVQCDRIVGAISLLERAV
jgi:hypothetical protein